MANDTVLVRKNFNGGEIAPELHYRSELDVYSKSCKSLRNMVVTPWGAVTRRPPTQLLSLIDTGSYGIPVKYMPFRFSLNEVFHIVFTDGSGTESENSSSADFIVFDETGSLVTLKDTTTKSLSTIYQTEDLDDLHHVQVNDFIYMTCGGNYPVQSINRFFDDVENENRWSIEDFEYTIEPLLDENTSESDILTIQLDNYDVAETYAEGDVVSVAGIGSDISSANFVYSHKAWGGHFWWYYYDIEINLATPADFSVGDVISVDDLHLGALVTTSAYWSDTYNSARNNENISGAYTIKSKTDNSTYRIDKTLVTSITSVPNIVPGGSSFMSEIGFLLGFYRSLGAMNTGNLLTNTTWWEPIEVYQGDVNVTANSDMFSVEDVGTSIAVRLDDSDLLHGAWEADTTSPSINAQGNVTLTTEGGAWDGLLELQESRNGGGTWKTIGFIRSDDGGSNGSITRYIPGVKSIIRVRLTEFDFPLSTYTTEKVLWHMTFDSNVNFVGKISQFIDARTVSVSPVTPLLRNISDFRYSFGAFSEKSGYPRALTIHDERMVFGGNRIKPTTVWSSTINDWGNFLKGDLDVSSYEFSIKTDSFDAIRWLKSTRNLMIGTENAEVTMGTRDNTSAISPTNVDVRTHTYFGSDNTQAITTADLVFFVQGQSERVRSTQYDFASDQYLSSEMSIFAHHITDSGIKEMSFRRHPYNSIFFVLNNGNAVSFTYEKDQQVKGWSRFDTSGSVVSAASNYSETGDIIAGIIKRGNDYYLESFGTFDETTVFLDNQIVIPEVDTTNITTTGIALTDYNNVENLVVVNDDTIVTSSAYTLTTSNLTMPDYVGGDIVLGIPFESEVIPTDIVDFGEHGLTKRSTKLSMYLRHSGEADIEVNDQPAKFTDGLLLNSGSRLNGSYDFTVGGGYQPYVKVKISTKGHRPLNLLGLGYRTD